MTTVTAPTLKTKSALSYFGSDSQVAAQLAGFLNECNHVTIAFAGGLSILPHLKARSIVANDLNNLAINFYRVASGIHGTRQRRWLISRCEHTLSHPSEMLEAKAATIDPLAQTPCLVAWGYWAQCWIGRKGKGGTKNLGGLPSVRRTGVGGTNATRIRSVANDIQRWLPHFERCEWESICFRELLPKCADDPKCGIYCDAPWVGAGRNYEHPFIEQDHIDLRDCLNRFEKTKIVVRYGDDPLIRELYQGWEIIEAESRTQARTDIKELWIMKNA